MEDFPGGPVVKNLPTKAGDKGLIPGLGRSHLPRGNKARTELACPRTHALQEEKPLEGEACALQLEKAHKQQQRCTAAKNK